MDYEEDTQTYDSHQLWKYIFCIFNQSLAVVRGVKYDKNDLKIITSFSCCSAI